MGEACGGVDGWWMFSFVVVFVAVCVLCGVACVSVGCGFVGLRLGGDAGLEECR
jgi:hypothetical protein